LPAKGKLSAIMSSKRSTERTNRKYRRERSRPLQQKCREAPAICKYYMIRIYGRRKRLL